MSAKDVLEVVDVSQRFARGLREAMRYAAEDILHQLIRPGRHADPKLRPGEFWALRNVSFSLQRGEAIGILGDNGAGKSTLLKLIAGIYKPTVGSIHVNGRIGAIVELGSAFAPNLSGRENIRPQALLQGYSADLLRRQLDRIIEFAALGDFIDTPVQHYSTGMRARLGFAVAAHGEPDLLVVDEVLAVGDLAFQNKCLRFVEEFRDRGGAVVFVGHNPAQMQAACERGIILERGRVAFDGSIVDALDRLFNAAEAESNRASPSTFANGSSVPAALPLHGPATRASVDVLASSVAHHCPRSNTTKGVIVLELTLAVHEVLPELRVAVTFFTSASPHAIAFSIADALSLPPGVHRVTMCISAQSLLPGDYLLKLAAVAGAAHFPHWSQGWQDAPRPLRIPGEPTMLTNLARLVSARIQLDCHVSTKEMERSTGSVGACPAASERETST